MGGIIGIDGSPVGIIAPAPGGSTIPGGIEDATVAPTPMGRPVGIVANVGGNPVGSVDAIGRDAAPACEKAGFKAAKDKTTH